MIRSKGNYFSENELTRIVALLRDSDMTLCEVAERMRCTRGAVAAINRKFQIRVYGGKRNRWDVNAIRPSETEIVNLGCAVLDLDRDSR